MKRLKFIIPVFLAILIVFCFTNEGSNKTIETFIGNDLNNITKINIIRGDGITETITDKKLINNVNDYLYKLNFIKVENKRGSGWTYSLNLFRGNKEILTITFIGEERCIFNVNGDWYKIVKSTDVTIESLFNKAKISKKLWLKPQF